jgi:hypothetical protein
MPFLISFVIMVFCLGFPVRPATLCREARRESLDLHHKSRIILSRFALGL